MNHFLKFNERKEQINREKRIRKRIILDVRIPIMCTVPLSFCQVGENLTVYRSKDGKREILGKGLRRGYLTGRPACKLLSAEALNLPLCLTSRNCLKVPSSFLSNPITSLPRVGPRPANETPIKEGRGEEEFDKTTNRDNRVPCRGNERKGEKEEKEKEKEKIARGGETE